MEVRGGAHWRIGSFGALLAFYNITLHNTAVAASADAATRPRSAKLLLALLLFLLDLVPHRRYEGMDNLFLLGLQPIVLVL